MAHCSYCNKDFEGSPRFCPECGAPVDAEAQETQSGADSSKQGGAADFEKKASEVFNKFTDTADFSADIDESDISDNKVMGVLAYCSWLVLIPLFAAKSSKFARFHCNQGIVLAIAELVLGFVSGIIYAIFAAGFFYWLFNIVFTVIWAICGIMSIIGIINAIQGKAKELPFIGKYRILK